MTTVKVIFENEDCVEIFRDEGLVKIPRKTERVFLDDVLFEVMQVYYHYDTDKPSKHIVVTLRKI